MKRPGFLGGIHLDSKKELTNSLSIQQAPVPDKLFIPLSQHLGAPCSPLVQVGDTVKKGQKIGEGKGFVTAPVHASVSGKVVAIEKKQHPGGGFIPCIVIENDHQEEWAENIRPHPNPQQLSAEDMRKLVFEAGIVGMGGATFPTHVKYSPNKDKPIECIIINGIECEPYITADHRTMLEKPDRIVAGLRYIMKMASSPKGIIAVEDNKLDAVEVLKEAIAGEEGIEVVVCPEKYPQGSEKQLIYACTGKEVPVGGLPLDVGIVVNNVGTTVAIADAIELGIPLIERIVTLSGNGIKSPANYLVRIGTLFKDLVAQSGGYTGEISKIIAGGPMMGKAIFTDDIPVIKGTSGILVLKREESTLPQKEQTCVRCSKCVEACPIFLEPTTIVKFIKQELWDEADKNNCLSCIECGACTYVCPARIPLVQYLRRGKQVITAAKRAKK